MTDFDDMMRTQDAIRRQEREYASKGLTEALRLVLKPTDKPECDRREIATRIRYANEHLRLYG